jgi:SAM-dependent methyltransferase
MSFSAAIQWRFHTSRYEKIRSLIGEYDGMLLDIGCGRPCESMPNCSLIAYLGRGIGLDKKRCTTKSPFIMGDILNMPIKKGQIKVIVASEVLEHLVDVDMALRNISYSLADGGILVVTTPVNNLLWRVIWPIWSRTFGRMWLNDHKCSLKRREWVDMINNHFTVTQVQTHWMVDLIVLAKTKSAG